MNTAFDYTSSSLTLIALASSLVLVACGPQNGEAAANTPQAQVAAPVAAPARQPVRVAEQPSRPVASAYLGEVRNIETLTERPKGTGAGAVVGGVLGGVVGHQVGSGNGQTAATAVGAIGGALLGNKVERDRRETIVGYRIQVRLDNGETRSFEEQQLSGLRVGDRVRVDGSRIHPA